MTEKEFAMAGRLAQSGELADLAEAYRRYYAEAGLDKGAQDELIGRRFSYRKMIGEMPSVIEPVAPDAAVTLGGRAWQIIPGYGHSPEHACLYDAQRRLLIAGDIVLPDITPNISLYPGSHGDPVGAYLETLERLLRLVPDDVIVFPSHGVPFRGLHKRLGELCAHHERRFARLTEVLKTGPQTAAEAMRGLFSHRDLAGSDVFFALGETMAHLSHELKHGRVEKTLAGGVGVYRLM
jgi:glyoxylase-like metal-dependent hydrolase (beta-lactamase superfamily II)